MSCLKVSVVVLLVSVLIGFLYGPELQSCIPHNIRIRIKELLPKQVLQALQDFYKVEKPTEKQDRKDSKTDTPRLFTKEELWRDYRGTEGSKGLYLAFFGKVYDVSEGKQYYAPGGGYDFFSGRDGTKGFVTGDFTDKGLTDDLEGLDKSMYHGFDEWVGFYDKTYKYVGLLVGNFYDDKGRPTKALKKAEDEIAAAKVDQEKRKADQKIYPMCNSESSAAKGSKVWCSRKSGGIDRDWVGVPRLYHSAAAPTARCACVKNTGPPSQGKDLGTNRGDLDNPLMKEYDNCAPDSPVCITKLPQN